MSDHPVRTSILASRVRGIANTLLLLGLLVFIIGWVMHWPAPIMTMVGLIMVTLFLVSSIAILVENRRIRQETEE